MSTFIQPEHLPVIERLAGSELTETMRKRVRLLLLYESGMKTADIADKIDLSPGRVLYWRRQYLKDGLGVFGDAVEDGTAKQGGAEGEGTKSKKSKKTKKSEKAKRVSLKKLTRRAKKASDGDDDAPRLDLLTGVSEAEERRRKLEKRLKHLKKKKASRARRRIEKLNRRIKSARKVLEKMDGQANADPSI